MPTEFIRRDCFTFQLWSRACKSWLRANSMVGVCRDNARNRRRHKRHINESNRMMRKLERVSGMRVRLHLPLAT